MISRLLFKESLSVSLSHNVCLGSKSCTCNQSVSFALCAYWGITISEKLTFSQWSDLITHSPFLGGFTFAYTKIEFESSDFHGISCLLRYAFYGLWSSTNSPRCTKTLCDLRRTSTANDCSFAISPSQELFDFTLKTLGDFFVIDFKERL